MRASTSKSKLLPGVRAVLVQHGYRLPQAAQTKVRLEFALTASLEKRRAEAQSAELNEPPADLILTVTTPADIPALVALLAQTGYVLLKQETVWEMDFSEPIRHRAARLAAGLAQVAATGICLLGCGGISLYWALFLYHWVR
jgi:hypothetical protein